MNHELKCWPRHFDAIMRGEKTFEIRKDKNFQVGDLLILKEYSTARRHTGRQMQARVTFVMESEQRNLLQPGYVCMSIKVIP